MIEFFRKFKKVWTLTRGLKPKYCHDCHEEIHISYMMNEYVWDAILNLGRRDNLCGKCLVKRFKYTDLRANDFKKVPCNQLYIEILKKQGKE